ncbi:DUF368 domain-containing protein [Haliangium ochraceum]|uniref:DUF368 domain-containing protein n=1 Tax=Haliangium ochraceum (strain DSM 14365 / JCM 11303 / SMP-2) TaxID=502025 RepID=D0LJW0_HALO1|nr:DUF368 domain-containing protein [Haliangium ochraceum]ACY18467.1 protein of unknown function DUF368 [Haliangium ochraceum DSM 14365]
MPEAETSRIPPHLSLLSGLLMGSADAVPGVSGGTIALIVGIYDRFIEALSTMVKAPLHLRSAEGRAKIAGALFLLVPLGIGIATALFLVTRLLVGPSEDPGVLLRPETAPICYGFFFGLVLVSLREPWRRLRAPGAGHVLIAVLMAVAAALFVALPYRSAVPPTWSLALGGAGAIAVMLLPGVSGSLFLVILGQYTVVTGALHDRNLPIIAVFLLGLGLGAVLFVPVLRHCLRRYHDHTMAALTGLMAGSLRALWPWKDNYQPKLGPMHNVGIGDNLLWVLIAAAAGAGVVSLLAILERRLQRIQGRSSADAPAEI